MSVEQLGRPWVRAVRPAATVRLVCLPFAGGGTADYRGWRDALSPAVDLCPVVLPGREGRLGEPAIDDLPRLVEALAEGLGPVLRLAPYVLYGHSMGAWLAFELARAVRRRGGPAPAHVVVGARRAPHLPARLPPLSHLPDPQFVDAVQQRYGGVPDALLRNPEMLALFLPTLRADLTLLDRYVFRAEPPLGTPVTALYGTGDRVEDPADVRAWREHSERFQVHPIPGGHFFHREAVDELADRLNPILREAGAA